MDLKKYFKFFGFKPVKKGDNGDIALTNKINKGEDFKDFKQKLAKMDSRSETIFNEWKKSGYISVQNNYQGMIDLFTELNEMFTDSALMQFALRFITDEVIQADSNDEPISIEGSAKIKKKLQEFHSKIGLNTLKLRALVESIVKFGNAGVVINQDENGVPNEINIIDIFNLQEILEFSPYNIKVQLDKQNSFLNTYKAYSSKVGELLKVIDNMKEYDNYFRTWNLGYVLNSLDDALVLPPWKFIHFKNITSDALFKPFGMPFFCHSLASYKKYDYALTMQQILRGLKAPIENYKISSAIQSKKPVEKMEDLLEMKSLIEEYGFGVTKSEDGLIKKIFTIDNALDFDFITPKIELDDLDDLEQLWENHAISTFLPRALIDPQENNFGESGVAYKEKSMMFKRFVYTIQTILCEGIAYLDKLYLLTQDDVTLEEIDFRLSMPFPEAQTDSNLIRSQSDLINLANNIIETFAQSVYGSRDKDAVPFEVVSEIYHKVLPYDYEVIEGWLKKMKKDKESEIKEGFYRRLKEKLGYNKLQEKINEVIFKEKQNLSNEGIYNNRHFFSSRNKSLYETDFLRDIEGGLIEKNKSLIKEKQFIIEKN